MSRHSTDRSTKGVLVHRTKARTKASPPVRLGKLGAASSGVVLRGWLHKDTVLSFHASRDWRSHKGTVLSFQAFHSCDYTKIPSRPSRIGRHAESAYGLSSYDSIKPLASIWPKRGVLKNRGDNTNLLIEWPKSGTTRRGSFV